MAVDIKNTLLFERIPNRFNVLHVKCSDTYIQLLFSSHIYILIYRPAPLHNNNEDQDVKFHLLKQFGCKTNRSFNLNENNNIINSFTHLSGFVCASVCVCICKYMWLCLTIRHNGYMHLDPCDIWPVALTGYS